MTYNPGADLARRYPRWVLRHRPLIGGIPEVLCWRRQVILIERHMSRSARLCAEAHAVAHLDLEHAATLRGVLEAREEHSADLLAARRMVEVRALASTLTLDLPPADLADELGVTSHLLTVRLNHLHPSERALIRRHVARREAVA